MRCYLPTALVSAALAFTTATAASADPLGALLGSLFGQRPAQQVGAGAPYPQSATTSAYAYAYAPPGNLSGGGSIPRQVVDYDGPYAPGTVIVSTSERRLYLVLPGGRALKYGIGVGREGFEWVGTQTITRKQEWPDWTPPPEMLRRQPYLPRFMAGGPGNPLGARAMYLGNTIYRIHGTNAPETIGQAVSSGCFRMVNEDVIDLYGRVKVGTKVVVI